MRYLLLFFAFTFYAFMEAKSQSLKWIKTIPFQEKHTAQYYFWGGKTLVIRGSKHAKICQPDGTHKSDSTYYHISTENPTSFILASKGSERNELFGIVDIEGREKTRFDFDWAAGIHFGYAILMKGGKGYLADSVGTLKPIPGGPYKSLHVLRPGLIVAQNAQDFKGLINNNGDTVIMFKYGGIYTTFAPHIFLVTKGPYTLFDEYEGLIDDTGKELVPIGNHKISVYEYYFEVQMRTQGATAKYYDLSGKELAQPPPSPASLERRKYIYQKKYPNGKVYGLKDSVSGMPITPLQYNEIKDAGHGLLEYTQQGLGQALLGYMTFQGEKIMERRPAFTKAFSRNDIVYFNDFSYGPWRWYNGEGKEILSGLIKKMDPLVYSRVLHKADTSRFQVLAVSLEGQKLGLYDRNGKNIVPEKFDSLVYMSKRTLYFKENTQKGLLNASGQIIATAPFDRIIATKVYDRHYRPLLQYAVKDAWGLMTDDGQILLPPKYKIESFYLVQNKYLWCQSMNEIEVYEYSD